MSVDRPDVGAAFPARDLFFDDVVVGAVLTTATHEVSLADIRTFADITRDQHPLHTDEDFCRTTAYGRPIAHGLYGLSLMEGLKAELGLYDHTSLGSLGWDKVRFVAPVFPGDRVHVRMRFASKRLSRDPARGVVVEEVELVNQHDAVMTRAEHVTLLKTRRGGETAPEPADA
jgi:acyl dehydratase